MQKIETTRISWLLFLFISFKLETFLRISFYFPCKQCECSAHSPKRIIIFVLLTFHFTLASHFIIWFCCVLFFLVSFAWNKRSKKENFILHIYTMLKWIKFFRWTLDIPMLIYFMPSFSLTSSSLSCSVLNILYYLQKNI